MTSFLLLLEERQTMLGGEGVGGHLLHGGLYSFLVLLKEIQTKLGQRCQLLHGGPTLLSAPSERKTDRARRETRVYG